MLAGDGVMVLSTLMLYNLVLIPVSEEVQSTAMLTGSRARVYVLGFEL